MAVPVAGMLPSRKALSMKLRVASASRFSSVMMRSSSSVFFAATKACHCASTLVVVVTESTNCSIKSFLLRRPGLELTARSMLARIIDVDLHLLDELDLEHHVVVDRFFLGFRRAAEFGVQIQVQALVVLKVALGEDFVACKIIKRREDVFQPQDRAEQLDECLLCRLADDGSA